MSRTLAVWCCSWWLVSCFAFALAQQPAALRLEPLRTYTATDGVTMAAAFAPDGGALALGSELGELRLLELPARRERWVAAPSDHWIGTIAFAPDGRRIACLGRDLTLHDTADGRELGRWAGTGPRAFAWSGNGARFVFSRMEQVLVHEAGRVRPIARFDYPVNALAMAADGTVFAGDNIGRTWRIPADGGAPELRRDHRAAHARTSAVALALAGGVLFDVAADGPLWRGDTELPLPGTPFALAVAPGGRTFAAGGENGIVRWWRNGGASSRDLELGKVAALALHPDGRTLFAASYDGRHGLHADGAAPVEVPGPTARVNGFALSPDASAVAIRTTSWRLHPTNGGPARSLPAAQQVTAGRRDGELLVHETKRLVIVDGRNGAELAAVPSNGASRWWRAAPGPGELLLVGDDLVDATTGVARDRPVPTATLFGTVTDTGRTADGRWAIGTAGGIEGESGELLVTNRDGEELHALRDGPIYTLAFSPDGSRLVYGCGHGISVGMGPPHSALRVRDARTFELLRDEPAMILFWRFLDDHRALALERRELQVRDARTLEVLQTLHLDPPAGNLALADDRRTLAYQTARDVRLVRLVAAR